MRSYRKFNNTEVLTNEDLLQKIQTVECSFGEPKMGKVSKKDSIVFDKIGALTVYVTASPRFIKIGHVATDGTARFAIRNFMTSLVSEEQTLDMTEADRAVQELSDLLEKDQEPAVVPGRSESKLYMRKKVLSKRDKYDICTEEQEPVYWVEESHGDFQIRNQKGDTLLNIEKKIVSFATEYTVARGDTGIVLGNLKKKNKLTKWELSGEFFGKQLSFEGALSDYCFSCRLGGTVIGIMNPIRLNWGDAYEIKICDPSREEIFLAVVVILDHILKGRI